MRHETKREAAIQANDKIQRIAEYEKDIEMEDVDDTRVGLARFINFANCLFIFHKNLFDNPFKDIDIHRHPSTSIDIQKVDFYIYSQFKEL